MALFGMTIAIIGSAITISKKSMTVARFQMKNGKPSATKGVQNFNQEGSMNMINELMDEYYNENARYVTKEEAVHNLLAAVLCQAVFDYRKELFLCIGKNFNGELVLTKNDTVKDLERFFDNMGFPLYKKLPDGILRFHSLSLQIPDEKFKDKHNRNADFVCPICQGTPLLSTRKQKVMLRPKDPRYAMIKIVQCSGCGAKDIIEPDIDEFIKTEYEKLKKQEENLCCPA